MSGEWRALKGLGMSLPGAAASADLGGSTTDDTMKFSPAIYHFFLVGSNLSILFP
jgi:hypothetical protein